MKKWIFAVMVFSLLAGVRLSGALALEGPFDDGVYEGAHAFVKVRVLVKDEKIAGIEILEHGGGGEKYRQMIEPLLERIVEAQSLEVDAVTGATVSSDYLKQAVRDALSSKGHKFLEPVAE